MNANDAERFRNCITALAEAYRQKITPATLLGYEMGLDDLPISSIERAVRKAIRTCKFMPAAVELRELAGEIPASARAALAWAAFERGVMEQGGYRTVLFDDPLINATVRNLGGWMRVCELPASEFDKWLRKDFERVYNAYAASGVGREAMIPMCGICSQTNSGLGYEDYNPPVLIETGLPAHPDVPLLTAIPTKALPYRGVAAEIGGY